MNDKPNFFVRILISILVAALCILIGVSFTLSEPRFGISSGLITVILIVVVLVLSESFNQLSIGKIFSLSKEVEKKKEENTSVKEENKELRQNLFKIVSNIQQSQVNNTFNAPPEAWLKLLGVVPSTGPKEDSTPEEIPQPDAAAIQDQAREEIRQKSRLKRSAAEVGLRKFTSGLGIPESSIIYGAEFSTAFHGIDPIMDRRVIFDCYLKGTDIERFIEVMQRDVAGSMAIDSLYIMLSKIYLYRQAKNTNAELILVVISTDFEDESRVSRYERLLEAFQPAIANKLLRIEYMHVTKEEAENGIQQRQTALF